MKNLLYKIFFRKRLYALRQQAKAILEKHSNLLIGLTPREREILAAYSREELRPAGLIYLIRICWLCLIVLAVYMFFTGGHWIVPVIGLIANVICLVILDL